MDCGIAVTPDVVKAQMQSGIGYGLSAALCGKITLTDGHVDQTNFHQYQVLRINDMPRQIEVYIVPSTQSALGCRASPGLPPIAPAVANAVRAATGIRLRTLPFDLARSAQRQGLKRTDGSAQRPSFRAGAAARAPLHRGEAARLQRSRRARWRAPREPPRASRRPATCRGDADP